MYIQAHTCMCVYIYIYVYAHIVSQVFLPDELLLS